MSINWRIESYKTRKKVRVNRDSMLSRLVAKSLDGRAFVNLVGCVSPAPSNGGETWCTLNWCEVFSNIRNNPK